jgi:putative transposase
MEGRARAHDNLFVARLWRSVQDEAVCLKDDPAAAAAAQGLGGWFDFYNPRRPRQSFDGWTPAGGAAWRPHPGPRPNYPLMTRLIKC